MLTPNNIDDILFAIEKAIGESYEPKHANGWKEIEDELLILKTQQSAPDKIETLTKTLPHNS